MKTKIAVIVIIGILLTSCAPRTDPQAHEVVNDVVVETSITQAPIKEEAIATEEFVASVATETSIEESTEPPLACVILLAPENSIELPATGKVTFSWTPLDGAGNYVLNFILPSGQTVAFETDHTFRDRYMDAFVSGGEYQWQVTAQGGDGSDICNSEMFTFNKPAYEHSEKPKPQGSGNNKGSDDSGNNGSGNEPPSGPPGEHDD